MRKPLDVFHPTVRRWFEASFAAPTAPQSKGWPSIARGDSTLLLAPTGTGKTLAAFLFCIDRLVFTSPPPDPKRRCRVLYVSPLKALAVDVERNLRAPLSGITRMAAESGEHHHVPTVFIRTGDTPADVRARFARRPDDVLITTPESLYLMLTSQAREALRGVETVIVDEIHALVPGKRGAHLALSLERLEALCGRPLQRIGLSATQKPLDEVARFLGGTATPAAVPKVKRKRGDAAREVQDEFASGRAPRFREVSVVDAGSRKPLALSIEVPVEDMAELDAPIEAHTGAMAVAAGQPSIWTAIHPRLLELVKAHRSTLVFVNARRLAERLAGALNELAGETMVLAHHGSIARAQRIQIEDDLKAGKVRGLVATSSLELGIDMGAIDLVVQIESPPSVSSGLQRIGRAGHRIDTPSEGVIFPKFRGDLLASAAITKAMREGAVEATRYPRNPLDVLAQQVVAMVAVEPWEVDELFALVRRAAPFTELSRGAFEGVLDMLSGRYPSDDFAELRPRITWDRIGGRLTGRQGAGKVAVANAGTIPDRGLYGVYLLGDARGARVGELDEEMVFETRPGETFVLGASTWRIEEITHDRVLVSPAPGEPGKMPFWKGDTVGRPVELGRAIGALARKLQRMPEKEAVDRLRREHDLDARAARNLLAYLEDQKEAAGAVPDDRTLVVERTRDELGEMRVCVLSPLGGRILAPWAMAVEARVREERGLDVETLWTNDGFVVRFPDLDEPPPPELLLPSPDEVESLVMRQLSSTAFFAARFRECAGRALLLPRRRPGSRSPLWQLRKKAADLMSVAARYGSFPIVLETYRECLRDAFDIPALVQTLEAIERREMRVVTVDSTAPSPFASGILFGYAASYLYDADAPLAERRAQALTLDQKQLRELLGEAELRSLLDGESIDALAAALQHLPERFRARSADGLHDLLLRLGDLTRAELAARSESEVVAASVDELVRARRAVPVRIAGEERFVAVEDASRYRDALGVMLPAGLPESLLGPVPGALAELLRRYARTHPPFAAAGPAARLGVARQAVEDELLRLVAAGRLLEGGFLPGGSGREFCDPEVLASVRRRSLARLRHEIEPVESRTLARLVTRWQGLLRARGGLDAVLDAVEKLQGCPLPASILETEILPARVSGYVPGDLDALAAAGEVVWCGVEPLGDRDGRIALYLTDHLPGLWTPPPAGDLEPAEKRVVDALGARGASFFGELHAALGGGFPGELVDVLWTLVWKGLVTNDTFRSLRAYTHRPEERRRAGRPFRTRRILPPTAAGRWTLVQARAIPSVSPTEKSARLAEQLLSRYGVVTRDVAAAEGIAGGFSAVYEVLRTLEESGRIRRGYFASGVGAMQFALPAAVEELRALRDEAGEPETLRLSATDPASVYGALLRWPEPAPAPGAEGARGRTPSRSVGTHVILVDGALAVHVGRGGRQLLTWLPAEEPDRSRVARAVAARLAQDGPSLVEEIDGAPASLHALGPYLEEAGFIRAGPGWQLPKLLPAHHA